MLPLADQQLFIISSSLSMLHAEKQAMLWEMARGQG